MGMVVLSRQLAGKAWFENRLFMAVKRYVSVFSLRCLKKS